ncbi:MAG: RNA 2',3'-cyclic phosphodiesterase [Candidatus Tagabacteria bacterium]
MKRRIFIAIQVPEEVKDKAEHYLEPITEHQKMDITSLLKMKSHKINIPKRKGWHVTVVFCGYLYETEIDELRKIVENVASKFTAFSFSPQKIIFSPPNRPRMIWLNFGFSPQFANLKKQIEDAISNCQNHGFFENFKPEMRKPNPHLTLGRFEEDKFFLFKNFIPREGIDLTKEMKPFFVEHIDIMESRLSRAGAEYEVVSKVILK